MDPDRLAGELLGLAQGHEGAPEGHGHRGAEEEAARLRGKASGYVLRVQTRNPASGDPRGRGARASNPTTASMRLSLIRSTKRSMVCLKATGSSINVVMSLKAMPFCGGGSAGAELAHMPRAVPSPRSLMPQACSVDRLATQAALVSSLAGPDLGKVRDLPDRLLDDFQAWVGHFRSPLSDRCGRRAPSIAMRMHNSRTWKGARDIHARLGREALNAAIGPIRAHPTGSRRRPLLSALRPNR